MRKTFLTAVLISLASILASCTTSKKVEKYQASDDAIKLVELLADPTPPDSKGIVDLKMKLASMKLVKMKDPRSVEPLIGVLNDKRLRGESRHNAAWVLGWIGGPRAVEPLITALKDEDQQVRNGAAEALGRIGDPRAVEPLIAALKDEEQRVRAKAAEALGTIGDARAMEPLITVLKDEYSDARTEAAKALGKIGDSLAVEPLIATLKDEKDDVRKETVIALGKIGDRRAVESLIASLSDKNWGVRLRAAEALGTIGDPRAGDGLVALLNPKEFDSVAEKVAWALERIGDPRAASAYDAWKKEREKMAQMRRPKYNRMVRVSLGPGQQFNLMTGTDLSRFFSELDVTIVLEEPMTIVCESGSAYAINREGLAAPIAVFDARTITGNPAIVSFHSYGTPSLIIQWKE